jgi:CBS domain-containing protein
VRKIEQTQSLPLAFRSLDVEGKTKPIPLVLCPARAVLSAAGHCGQCPCFKRIEFSGDGQPVLCCVAAAVTPARPRARPSIVRELLRLPSTCGALETPIVRVLRRPELASRADMVPVLDRRASPRGFVTLAMLERVLSQGASLDSPLERVMLPFLTPVLPDAQLQDAARLIEGSVSGSLVALAFDGSLLGVLSARDLTAWERG